MNARRKVSWEMRYRATLHTCIYVMYVCLQSQSMYVCLRRSASRRCGHGTSINHPLLNVVAALVDQQKAQGVDLGRTTHRMIICPHKFTAAQHNYRTAAKLNSGAALRTKPWLACIILVTYACGNILGKIPVPYSCAILLKITNTAR